jgi:hypothetical protein
VGRGRQAEIGREDGEFDGAVIVAVFAGGFRGTS